MLSKNPLAFPLFGTPLSAFTKYLVNHHSEDRQNCHEENDPDEPKANLCQSLVESHANSQI